LEHSSPKCRVKRVYGGDTRWQIAEGDRNPELYNFRNIPVMVATFG
jgi:hypothetical protein